MEIKKATLAERCEVCHQTDQFDPEKGECYRCQSLLQMTSSQERTKQELSLLGLDMKIANKKIQSAVFVGGYLSLSTLVLTILAIFFPERENMLPTVGVNIVAILVLSLLTFGIYKKSRVATSLLLVYFAAGRILMLINGHFQGWWLLLIGSYVLFQGVMGTIDYHELVEKEKQLLSSH